MLFRWLMSLTLVRLEKGIMYLTQNQPHHGMGVRDEQ